MQEDFFIFFDREENNMYAIAEDDVEDLANGWEYRELAKIEVLELLLSELE